MKDRSLIDPDRAVAVARWLTLTREVLPEMAAQHRWPIRLDHCFMRVFLDHAAAGQWDRVVSRPAIRHMPLAMLTAAIELAEAVLAEPERLPQLNAQSLAWRSGQRQLAGRGREGVPG